MNVQPCSYGDLVPRIFVRHTTMLPALFRAHSLALRCPKLRCDAHIVTPRAVYKAKQSFELIIVSIDNIIDYTTVNSLLHHSIQHPRTYTPATYQNHQPHILYVTPLAQQHHHVPLHGFHVPMWMGALQPSRSLSAYKQAHRARHVPVRVHRRTYAKPTQHLRVVPRIPRPLHPWHGACRHLGHGQVCGWTNSVSVRHRGENGACAWARGGNGNAA